MILVVDDELTLAELLRDVLEDEGHRVVTATDGREALACLAEDRPDLVLSDVMMPHLDGRELARALHADPSWQVIPLVLMSAAGATALNDVPYAAFIGKPFDLDVLLTTVTRLLAGHKGQ